MTIRDPHGPAPVGVSAALALVVGVACFGAFAVLGLGMLSYFADIDIIAVEGLSMWPGLIGMIVAVIVFAIVLGVPLRRQHPTFAPVFTAAVAAMIGHLAVVWVAAMAEGAGYAHAAAAVSQLITRGPSLVVLAAGLIAGSIAVALRRSRSGTPRWPWEREDEE